ncbi:hypothetical protein SAMN05444162_0906 [Paenibacillaceae bacterium GAS479]|nr:hypothetical protein SAMN05444162_0906 [Paenibacillaceae bacterium GAS479]
MGDQKTEYAKNITHYPPQSKIFGIRTVVTIPSETSIGVFETTNGNGFIDANFSLDRMGTHYECGLSQEAGQATYYGLKNTKGGNRWHYFTAPSGDGEKIKSLYTLAPGRQVPIEFTVNSDGTMQFKVDNNTVQTYKKFAPTDGITTARLVVGLVDQDFGSISSIPSSPLTAWGTYTTPIACQNYAIQTVQDGAWIPVNVTDFNRLYWPTGYTHQTNPQDLTVSKGNGYLTVSLTKPKDLRQKRLSMQVYWHSLKLMQSYLT